MPKTPETALYAPVKGFFEALGYDVKGEIGAADLMAVRGNEPPVIVELKTGFSLTLLQQAVARQAVTDDVYVAVPRWSGKPGWRAFKGNVGLCKRLGLGVLSVRVSDGVVQCHADPGTFQPRKSKARRAALMKEFNARAGDPTAGGTRGQVMTAYRQDAGRVAAYLATVGQARGAEIAKAIGVVRATGIMSANHYGWFYRVKRGVYALTEAGAKAVRAQKAGG